MRRPSVPPPPSTPPTPPFDAPAARRLRLALQMGPEHVAYGMQVSYGLPYITSDHVIAWERGITAPGKNELTALAGVLWCAPYELIGRPRTLREHRAARGLSAEDVARAVGLELLVYVRMEESGEWRGTERQSAVLAEVLELSLADLTTLTGLDGRLAGLLRGAVTTRWQAYVRPVNKMVPLNRRLLESTLQELHRYYQRQLAATRTWGAGGSATVEASRAGRDFLDRIVEHFWARLGSGNPDNTL
ncbi:helix-turn-helix transcriptional regulator [Streptomyces sp. NPDC047042]|uniref:helix-turn-helix domain-containing protein n=1 Tax=Streptomyces sp. NPDC047042 TaxID=3154807 RepID=UPI0033E2BB61